MRRHVLALYRVARMSDRQTFDERRAAPRIDGPFAFRARSRHPRGRLDINTVVDNLGRRGVYTRLPAPLDVNRRLFGLVSLPTGSIVAVRGRVVRRDSPANGLWGTAVCVTSARLFPDHTSDVPDHVQWPGRVHS
jgi:hypothetical protein